MRWRTLRWPFWGGGGEGNLPPWPPGFAVAAAATEASLQLARGRYASAGPGSLLQSPVRFFAVLDGHGGRLAADFAAAALPRLLVAQADFWEGGLKPESLGRALGAIFIAADEAFLAASAAVRAADSAAWERSAWRSGTTALVAAVCVEGIALASLGDCRAVLCELGSDAKAWGGVGLGGVATTTITSGTATAATTPGTWSTSETDPGTFTAGTSTPAAGFGVGVPSTSGSGGGGRAGTVDTGGASCGGVSLNSATVASHEQQQQQQRQEQQQQQQHASGGTVARALTLEHTPASERARIEAAGGWVVAETEYSFAQLARVDSAHPVVARRLAADGAKLVRCSTVSRLNGELGVARALGDADYKGEGARCYPWAWPRGVKGQGQGQQIVADLVTAEPQIVTLRPSEYCVGAVLVLACDGLWEVLESSEAAELVAVGLVCGSANADVNANAHANANANARGSHSHSHHHSGGGGGMVWAMVWATLGQRREAPQVSIRLRVPLAHSLIWLFA